jgi:hypothetical protein
MDLQPVVAYRIKMGAWYAYHTEANCLPPHGLYYVEMSGTTRHLLCKDGLFRGSPGANGEKLLIFRSVESCLQHIAKLVDEEQRWGWTEDGIDHTFPISRADGKNGLTIQPLFELYGQEDQEEFDAAWLAHEAN